MNNSTKILKEEYYIYEFERKKSVIAKSRDTVTIFKKETFIQAQLFRSNCARIYFRYFCYLSSDFL